MKVNKKVFAVLMLVWVLSSCTSGLTNNNSTEENSKNELGDNRNFDRSDDFNRGEFDGKHERRGSGMTDEQKAEMEEMKTIMDKQKSGEELTEEEKAKLDGVKNRMIKTKQNFNSTGSINESNTGSMNESNTSSSDEVSVSDSDKEKTLTINNKCIGCDHCTRTAPDNFAMDWSTHKAYVTSQENIDGSAVANAIARCRVGAIELG